MNGEIIENMHTDNRVDQNGLNTKHTKIGDGPDLVVKSSSILLRIS